MKHILLFAFLTATSLSLSAQIDKGNFMFEAGIKLFGDGLTNANPFTETSGISFSSNERFLKNASTGEEESINKYHQSTYSFAPRFGYSLFRNFVLGADLKYFNKKYTYATGDYHDKYQTMLYGFFMRQYFGKNKIVPIAEGGVGFGLAKSITDESGSGGGHFTINTSRNLYYFSGAAGASFRLNTKLRINLLAKIQRTTEKPNNSQNYSTSETRTVDIDTGLILSFSYFLNHRTKQVLE
jgi:hypothetical protein